MGHRCIFEVTVIRGGQGPNSVATPEDGVAQHMLAVTSDPPQGTFNPSPVRQEEPVRVRILVAAAVVSGGWLAACSKPAQPADERARAQASENARQIRLAEPPGSDGAVVSDLEARHPLKPVLVRRTSPKQAIQATSIVESPSVAPAPPHVMSTTETSMAEAPRVAGLSRAPEAAATGFGGSIGHGLGAFEAPAPASQSLGSGSRGPTILIRGGMGGIDDKCDLRGGHRGGISINRSAPAFGGYSRGGIR